MDTMLKCFSIFLLAATANGGFAKENEEYLTFPSNFLLGAATAAYQIEGAWNMSDKGESTWDRFAHQNDGRVFNNQNGDIACDSYHKFKEDVAIMKKLGFKSYRLSVSWPRIIPNGFSSKVSKDGINYYKRVIDELLANGIEPMVTIYHWDHHQSIEEVGGWLNPNIIDWFTNYARVVFTELGPKVKTYITINEPNVICTHGYSNGQHAPGKTLPGIAEYLCAHNVLKAHAKVYRMYEKEFKKTQKGKIGINANVAAYYPKNKGDQWSVERGYEFYMGWILNPIYSEKGDYPEVMKETIANLSKAHGYSSSRLPVFEPEWVEYIRGSADFLALNHYTSFVVEPLTKAEQDADLGYKTDPGIRMTQPQSWKAGASEWLKVVPAGFGDLLRDVAKRYGNHAIYITENGFSDRTGTSDIDRIDYYRSYLEEMLIAIHRDKVNVQGFYVWSLLDNFEWNRGYSERFGIVHIDFTDPRRTRTLKQSAYWWQRIAHNRKLDKFY